MDIAQYIGLFLLKNEYCYLPGIGSLSVVRKPAAFNSATQEMNPPVYEVVFQKSIGSIDDAFANFIANNERISIAHASNHFRDYCARMKTELREGREMIIPGIGKLAMDADQQIRFTQDPHLEVKGKAIPFFKNSQTVEKKKEDALTNIIKRTEIKEPKADEEIIIKPPQVNWAKIVILILVIGVILAGIIYLVSSKNDLFNNPAPTEETTEEVTPVPPVESLRTEPAPAVADTQVVNPGRTLSYRVVLNTYDTRERAERRVDQLLSYGNKVALLVVDSTHFSVVMNFTTPASDTTRIIDSLRRIFNPDGNVRIAH